MKLKIPTAASGAGGGAASSGCWRAWIDVAAAHIYSGFAYYWPVLAYYRGKLGAAIVYHAARLHLLAICQLAFFLLAPYAGDISASPFLRLAMLMRVAYDYASTAGWLLLPPSLYFASKRDLCHEV